MFSTVSPASVSCEKRTSSFSRLNVRSNVGPKHPHLHQMYQSLKKVKSSLLTKRDHQEKRPQDGKTNPME